MIITDHHTIEDDLPNAVACVNPKREPQGHPLRELCGAGVAWMLARALVDATAELGYVALGTVADVVPLSGVNRVLVAKGLKELSTGSVLGVIALAGKANVNLRDLRAEHIAFQLG
ncbi:MAG: single-stranded-DNA-specific exonuclease RecJ, partial [Bacteroidetes bacterium]|nr:single-stranded-DNA-specific exonuclease RecJ [Bacteroidota bacterium]